MWFSNAIVFQFDLPDSIHFNDAFIQEALKPCPPHARSIFGWTPVCDAELVQEVAGCAYFSFSKEERILPRAVIKRILAERVLKLEADQGRSIKRAEKARMAEELEFELLPKSFCIQKNMPALLDHATNRLIINTSSPTQAAALTSLLRKTISDISIEPLDLPDNLSIRFTDWINDPDTLPSQFRLATDCLLFSLNDEKKRFNCKGYELPAEEILSLISKGLAAAEVSLIWQDRIQFTLTQDFVLKKVKCHDYLVDEFNEIRQLEEERQQQDAALTLLSGELRALVNDLLSICS